MKNPIKTFLSKSRDIQLAFFHYEGCLHQPPRNKIINFDDKEWSLPTGWTFTCVEDIGGTDQGSDYYKTFLFSKDGYDIYYKFKGWYQSYNGASYQSYFEVQPQRRVVTTYEKT